MKHQHPIIRKKRKSGHAAHHGGSWKIAYADFMTAMMALFLVMWLIAISSPSQLAQIAEYFRTPLKIAITSGPKMSDASNPIPGGGSDPTQQEGDVKRQIDTMDGRLEEIKLNKLRERLDQLIEADPRLKALRPHLLIEMVDEGLRIQIIDSNNRPMFKTGSAQVEPYMSDILRAIAPILNDIPNKISLSGHTDDAQYAMGERGYSNWELSADRANASRRELIIGGLAEGKVLRVVGMADTMNLKQAKGGSDAINRRISLVVLNKQAQENIERENAESSAVNIDKIENLQNMGMDKTKPAAAPADNGSSTVTPQPENNGTPASGSTVAPAPAQAPATTVPTSGANGASTTGRRQPTTALPAAPDSQATPSSTSRDSQQR
ncbi:flagellar motor protein MotB [Dickeya undicola]|uniref:Motility protein MotB n=1 Tax=Dickeya undicola TaxID=1577887 RepID=A0A3N0G5F8_9GAMM|nr:flagellar motor protein MotB [Dickeya undicola]RNM07674.1 motility protein MotB [Dickeya undicola]RNM26708.1 motility protein MotB [Dickeya undicola]